jgi:ubiquinone/menaquinone biosynthesis C-methylase UbiE
MENSRLVAFGRIDQTADPGFFVRFLDAACATASVQAYKRRIIELLELAPGRRVLDVGCGTGDDVREIAKHVGADGKSVGIDNSQAMIGVARQRAAGSILPVEFHVAEVGRLPFEAASFNGCVADRSLMHVPDPRQALVEMARVTKPGGRVVVYEVDFGGLIIDADDRMLGRKIINTWCDGFRDGWLGRRIPTLAADVGLVQIEVAPYPLMLTPELATLMVGQSTVDRAVEQAIVTSEEGKRWLDHLAERARVGRFFGCLSGFLLGARVR